MAKILLLSNNKEKMEYLDEVLTKSSHDFQFALDDQMFNDLMSIDLPQILLLDSSSTGFDFPAIYRYINSKKENLITITLVKDDNIPPELMNVSDAFVSEPISDNILLSTININLRRKTDLVGLSQLNKNLTNSLYQLEVLYNLGKEFSATNEKEKLIDIMLEGLDKALGFSVACVLTFKSDNEPLLIVNSINQISDSLFEALKLRAVINYKSLFENKEMPFELDINNLKAIKYAKNPIEDYDFSVLRQDNMLAQINLNDKFFGFVEVYRDTEFTNEDSQCFHTIAQQVSMPLKNASYIQEIQNKNKELYRLEHIKSDFISIVSHELKTPITPLKTSLQILSSGRAGELTDNMKLFLGKCENHVNSFQKIIKDLLDISKIEAGKLEYNFADTNLESCINFVKSQYNSVIDEKELTLTTSFDEGMPIAYADKERINQVLNNLISNAIKFTERGKNIDISTKIVNAKDIVADECFSTDLKKLDGRYIQVCVKDEGLGVEKENLSKIFEPFRQVENSLQRQAGGTGLGLPIVKKILNAHNGTIWVDSEIGKGSKFCFVLPVLSEKSVFWINHKQRVQDAKINKTTFIVAKLSSNDECINNLKMEENFLNEQYLNNSLIEKQDNLTTLTMAIPDGNKALGDFLKIKLKTIQDNNYERYGACDIMFSYKEYPKEND